MTTDLERLEFFLWDAGSYIKERALEARVERDATAKGSPEREFQDGRVIAFNEVISILQQTLEGFGLSAEAMQLDDLNPDEDLV